MARRAESKAPGDQHYVTGSLDDPSSLPRVRRWQDEVHRPGIYDLEVDTSVLKPEECAALIQRRVRDGPPGDAFTRIARGFS